MKSMKKVLTGILAVAMMASLGACSGGTTEETTAGGGDETTSAANGGGETTTASAADVAAPTGEDVSISISWWGGDSRHEATQNAINAFTAKNPNIKVDVQFGAWSGWEDAMSTSFYAGTAPDVNQINWNWIESYSSDGSVFLDMNSVSDYFDLTQYSQAALDTCTLAGKLQAIPVSMTGRIFYWNKTTFDNAGVATPTSLDTLYSSADAMKEKLGDDYYPIALGEYDRMILMVYYLESKYGKPWVEAGKLNYSVDEIKEGLTFIDGLEDKHVTPSIATILGDGAESLDKNPKWMDGVYAGIFEWDSSASKFEKALNEGQEFIVGDYMPDMGDNKGGFSKVSLAFAISQNTQHPAECAMLLNFLLNDPEGTAIMASERGIPLSKAALDTCQSQDLLNAKVAEANGKVLDWVSFNLDAKFEDSGLKGNPDGVYYDVFSGLSYDEYSIDEAAQILVDGINGVLES